VTHERAVAGDAPVGGRTGGRGGRDSLAGRTGGSVAGAGGIAGRSIGGAGSGRALAGRPGLAGTGGSEVNAGSSTVGGTPSDGGAGGEAGTPVDRPEGLLRDILTTGLELDTTTRRGTATITLAPSSSEIVTFEIGNLVIESVEHDGALVAFDDRGALLDVRVPLSIEPATVVITYRYYHHEEFDGVSTNGYSITWPDFCGNVFPCHSDPADGVRFSLKLSGGSVPFVHASEIPFEAPSYMLGWVQRSLTELALGSTSVGTSVSVFFDPVTPSAEDEAKLGTGQLVAGFDWYETTLGAYRFGSKVGSVPAPWPGGFTGMEHHPLWHVRTDRMNDPFTHFHEAAHGWFGNGVRLRCWGELALSEGTASYLASRALEAVGNLTDAAKMWQTYEAWADDRRYSSQVPAWSSACGPYDHEADNYQTYTRGALFLRALEQRIGRETLDEALRAFYGAYVGNAAGIEDLLATVHATSGFDPRNCAAEWLQQSPLPRFVPCE
jgi:aminopeptidase N